MFLSCSVRGSSGVGCPVEDNGRGMGATAAVVVVVVESTWGGGGDAAADATDDVDGSPWPMTPCPGLTSCSRASLSSTVSVDMGLVNKRPAEY